MRTFDTRQKPYDSQGAGFRRRVGPGTYIVYVAGISEPITTDRGTWIFVNLRAVYDLVEQKYEDDMPEAPPIIISATKDGALKPTWNSQGLWNTFISAAGVPESPSIPESAFKHAIIVVTVERGKQQAKDFVQKIQAPTKEDVDKAADFMAGRDLG